MSKMKKSAAPAVIIAVAAVIAMAMAAGVAAADINEVHISTWGELTAAISSAAATPTTIYLDSDITATGTLSITAGRNITLRSYGGGYRSLSNGSNVPVITVAYGATLTLDGIDITRTNAGIATRGVVNNGTLIINAGLIRDHRLTGANSGAGVQNNGAFTMNGGAISDNTLTGNGNGAGVQNNGTFTMNGGTISGNTLTGTGNGAGVWNADGAVFAVNGGTISNNSAPNGDGGGVFTSLSDLRAGNLTVGANAVFSGNSARSHHNRISADDAIYAGFIHGTQWSVGSQGFNNYDISYTEGTVQVGSLWELNNAISDAGGSPLAIYLTANISVTSTVSVPSGANITLRSASGAMHSLTAASWWWMDVLTVESGASLTLDGVNVTRTSGDGRGVVNHGELILQSGAIFGHSGVSEGAGVLNFGTFRMYGGEIRDNTAWSNGGGVFNAGTLTFSGGEIRNNTAEWGGGVFNAGWATLTLNGGTISNNSAWSNGGGVYTQSGAALTLNGGAISNNIAWSNGGGVHNSGTLTMNSGTISNNPAWGNGGGVYNAGWAALTLNSGTISNNSAPNGDGGGVWMSLADLRGGRLFIGANAVFSGNSASAAFERQSSDNAIYAEFIHGTQWTASFTQGFNNYDISYTYTGPVTVYTEEELREAVSAAAADALIILVANNITLTGSTLSIPAGATITLQSAGTAARAITANGNFDVITVHSGAVLTIDGVNISRADGRGRGIANNGALTLLRGTISGHSDERGGGVRNTGAFEMRGGEIRNNTAGNGGGVYNAGWATFRMYGGAIRNNTASGDGGGIYISMTDIRAGRLFIGEDAIFGDNTADNAHDRLEDDDDVYYEFIFGTSWTSPFRQGFNNFDISYGVLEDAAQAALRARVAGRAGNSEPYVIYIEDDIPLTRTTLAIPGGADITLRSADNGNHTLVAMGTNFTGITVEHGATLTIDGVNITRISLSGAGRGIINHGTLVLLDGAIFGHTGTADGGGVLNHGTFTMYGGEIRDNNVSASADRQGGGVLNHGTFIMNGGTISGNGVTVHDSWSNATGRGGGVFNQSWATFEFNGGEISGNTVSASDVGQGGGVFNAGWATFEFNGGKIGGNDAHTGGGVWNESGGEVTMNGGEISGNDANSGGGVFNSGTFTMAWNSGASISGNTAEWGGGVLNSGTFNMNWRTEISGNTATTGGGVFNGGTFNMRNGEISGNTAASGGGAGISGGMFEMSGGEIVDNTARSTGGGIWISPAAHTGRFDMIAGTVGGNTANSGGGVWLNRTRLRSGALSVRANAVFRDNAAASTHDLLPEDIIVYRGFIYGTQWTVPFTHGFNNHDIAYTESDGETVVSTEAELRSAAAGAGVGHVVIYLANDIALTETALSIGGGSTITLRSAGAATHSLTADGSFDVITVESGATLTIDGIRITRETDTYGRGVWNGGTLYMLGGEISGHTAELGGGVWNNGAFTMNGGTISGNTALSGGGVWMSIAGIRGGRLYIGENAVFSGNRAVFAHERLAEDDEIYAEFIRGTAWSIGGQGLNNYDISYTSGPGTATVANEDELHRAASAATAANRVTITLANDIALTRSLEILWGRDITLTGSALTASGRFDAVTVAHGARLTIDGIRIARAGGYGSGVANHGELYMLSGEISGHFAANGGGVRNYGAFTLRNGAITRNTAERNGGGVFNGGGAFEMTGGIISNNTAQRGGGVWTGDYGAFHMRAGRIANNTALWDGGGVWICIEDIRAGNLFSVGADAVFTGNSANTAHAILETDLPVYRMFIHGVRWTAPFTQGFNNWDIAYTAGANITPEMAILRVSTAAAVRTTETVTVNITLENNPGFTVMPIRVHLPDGVTLADFEIGEGFRVEDIYGADFTGPGSEQLRFIWTFPENNANEGLLLSLTLNISGDLAMGRHPVEVTFGTAEGEALPINSDRMSLNMVAVSGAVLMNRFVIGDVNSDGIVDIYDLILLAQHLAAHSVPHSVDEEAARVTLDSIEIGAIRPHDLLALARYIVEDIDELPAP